MYGGVLTGLSGVISSPGYALEYNNNASCSWTVHVPNQSVVSLVFLDFQLENNEGCNFDCGSLWWLMRDLPTPSPHQTICWWSSNQTLILVWEVLKPTNTQVRHFHTRCIITIKFLNTYSLIFLFLKESASKFSKISVGTLLALTTQTSTPTTSNVTGQSL